MLYTVIEDICVLKMVGTIAYEVSPDLDRFLTKMLDNLNVKRFVIDLTETSYIDSTNLGVLVKLYRFSCEGSIKPTAIISPHSNINEMLSNIGFFNIFNIVKNLDNIKADLVELPHEECDKNNLAKIMFDAHLNLSRLTPENREQFKDVVKFLQQDL